MFEYNDSANRKLWDLILKLSDDQFQHPADYSIGSVHDQVVHMMGAERMWLQRVQGKATSGLPETAEYPTQHDIRAEWDVVTEGWFAYLDRLSDEQIAEDFVEYVSINGNKLRQTPLWECLAHVINHSTDHRAQTLALIHQAGGETQAQDLIFYSWENPL